MTEQFDVEREKEERHHEPVAEVTTTIDLEKAPAAHQEDGKEIAKGCPVETPEASDFEKGKCSDTPSPLLFSGNNVESTPLSSSPHIPAVNEKKTNYDMHVVSHEVDTLSKVLPSLDLNSNVIWPPL